MPHRHPSPFLVLALITLALGIAVYSCGDSGGGADGPVVDGGADGSSTGDGAAGEYGPPDRPITGLVDTDKGRIRGTVHTTHRSFLGIPYAAPPVGQLRWKAPEPHPTWVTTRDAMKFGPSCPQEAGMTRPNEDAEDCLTLNVWTPLRPPAKPAPVMVWIHGGGFISGGSATTTYNGSAFAVEAGSVVVTINYRLGALGFLAHPALGEGSGNFGLLDQRLALQWVKKNIAAFGGDPDNVTIFGQSAGSMSVCAHVVSPLSKGLFHRAIMQSGPCSWGFPTKQAAEAQGQKLAEKLGCDKAKDPVSCMRGKGVKEARTALALKSMMIFGDGVNWGPTIDGVNFTSQPEDAIKTGSFNKVPIVLGSNKDEGSIFLILSGLLNKLTEAEYKKTAEAFFGARAGEAVARYPASSYKNPGFALMDVIGDAGFVCPLRRNSRYFADNGVKVWHYHFTHDPSISPFAVGKAYHGCEIPFIFRPRADLENLRPEERKLSAKMSGYWGRFALLGTPDSPGATSWPAATSAAPNYMEFTLSSKVGKDLKKDKCTFWDSFPRPKL